MIVEVLAPSALLVLSLVDGAFTGFRDAAGRNPRIHKDAYYRASFRRGARAAGLACAACALWVIVSLFTTGDPAWLFDLYVSAAARMVLVYGAYATVVLGALAVWAITETDVRTLASVVILGPFTMVRPTWIVLGALFGTTASSDARVLGLCGLACLTQLAIAPLLARGWHKGQVPLPLE